MSADCLERSQLPRRSLLAGLLLACSVGSVAPMQAQVPDSARKKAVQDTIKKEARQEVVIGAHVVRWYEVAAALGGITATMAPRCFGRKVSQSTTPR